MGTITPAATQQFPFWNPIDDGFKGFNADPANQSGGGVAIAGTVYVQRLPIRTPTLVTNLWYNTSTVAVGASNGCFVWIINGATGAVLCQSADCLTQFETVGWNAYPMTTPTVVGGGAFPWVYAATLSNAVTTQVGLGRMFNSQQADPQTSINLATQRWGSKSAFGTAVGPITMSGLSGTAFTFCVGWN